ncbi:MAG: hypothetical protein IMF19_12875 [Proteobacteria bacterium]|nr:hypothetical protein [Pseudomonadota bacterium]
MKEKNMCFPTLDREPEKKKNSELLDEMMQRGYDFEDEMKSNKKAFLYLCHTYNTCIA